MSSVVNQSNKNLISDIVKEKFINDYEIFTEENLNLNIEDFISK